MGQRCLPARTEPSRCPRVPAITLLATRSRCHASSFSAQQPYPARGRPRPRPPPLPRAGWGGGGGLAGSLPCLRRRAVGAGARRGRRSPSWDGGDGPGRHGRRGAAPLLTTQLPPPSARPRPRPAPPMPGCQSRQDHVSSSRNPVSPSPEYPQGSGPCLSLHILRFSSSRPGASSVAVSPSFLSLTASPFIPTLGRPRYGARPPVAI